MEWLFGILLIAAALYVAYGNNDKRDIEKEVEQRLAIKRAQDELAALLKERENLKDEKLTPEEIEEYWRKK